MLFPVSLLLCQASRREEVLHQGSVGASVGLEEQGKGCGSEGKFSSSVSAIERAKQGRGATGGFFCSSHRFANAIGARTSAVGTRASVE